MQNLLIIKGLWMPEKPEQRDLPTNRKRPQWIALQISHQAVWVDQNQNWTWTQSQRHRIQGGHLQLPLEGLPDQGGSPLGTEKFEDWVPLWNSVLPWEEEPPEAAEDMQWSVTVNLLHPPELKLPPSLRLWCRSYSTGRYPLDSLTQIRTQDQRLSLLVSLD